MSPRSGQDGFTLVELLVAIALLALMAGYATVVIGQMTRTRDIEARIARDAEIDAAIAYVERAIESTRPLSVADPASGKLRPIFLGDESALILVTEGDRRLEPGGLHVAEFRVNDAARLVTRRRLHRPAKNDEPPPATIPLLTGVERFALRYYGAPAETDTAAWRTDWHDSESLPRLVEFTLGFSGGATQTRRVALPLAR